MLNFSPAALFIGIFAGICGMAYFAYGKKHSLLGREADGAPVPAVGD